MTRGDGVARRADLGSWRRFLQLAKPFWLGDQRARAWGLLATLAMAYGWTEFWLIWIAVDAVGVPLLVQARFYPSALMYGVYALLCVVGLASWWRQSQAPAPQSPAREQPVII